MARTVYVFAYPPNATEAVPAGLFEHDADAGVGRFQYGTRYAARADAWPVDPADCPLDGQSPAPTALHHGLYGAFRDASPDYWGRMVIARRLKRDASTLDPIDLLLEGGASRVGALDFRTARDAPEPDAAMPTLTSLPELVTAAEDLRAGKAITPEVEELLHQGTTLGGMRPKCVVEADNALWLAKFPAANDTFDNPRVEAATLALGKKAGITVPDARIHALADGRAVLLVRRFDRDPIAGGYARTAFVSALTLFRSDEDDRARWSYPGLAQELRRLTIGRAMLEELFRRMVFNAAIRNVDDHPRNHGVLYDHEGYRLAPAYDLSPHPAKRGVATEFQLAMSLGSEGRLATVGNLLSSAADFGLDQDRARAVMGEVGHAVAGAREHYEGHGVATVQLDLFEASFDLATEMQKA